MKGVNVNEYGAVVLYYRRGVEFRSTLDDLLSQSVPPSDVVVVDNASNDGVIESISHDYPSVSFIESASNVGYSGGMNLGMRSLRADSAWILCLTHEVRLDQDCVSEMLSAAGKSAIEVVQAGPVLQFLGTADIWSRGGAFTRTGAPVHIVARESSADFQEVNWLDGSCTLTRSAAFAKYGHFDEDFYLYWEDVELSTRFGMHGAVINVSTANAKQSTSTTPVYYKARNRVLYWRKRRSLINVVHAVVFNAAKLSLQDVLLRKSGWRLRARARRLGMVDGFSGRLRPDLGGVREI